MKPDLLLVNTSKYMEVHRIYCQQMNLHWNRPAVGLGTMLHSVEGLTIKVLPIHTELFLVWYSPEKIQDIGRLEQLTEMWRKLCPDIKPIF